MLSDAIDLIAGRWATRWTLRGPPAAEESCVQPSVKSNQRNQRNQRIKIAFDFELHFNSIYRNILSTSHKYQAIMSQSQSVGFGLAELRTVVERLQHKRSLGLRDSCHCFYGEQSLSKTALNSKVPTAESQLGLSLLFLCDPLWFFVSILLSSVDFSGMSSPPP